MSYAGYQNLGSNQWSSTAVFTVTAVASACVGLTVGVLASGSSSAMYAPVANGVSSVATRGVVAPSVRPASPLAAQQEIPGVPMEVDSVAAYATPSSEASVSWAPLAALVAVPTALAAFFLKKSEQHKALDVETAFSGVRLAAAGVAASAILGASAMAPPPAQAADIAGLEPCASSKKFQKNLKKEIKTLEKRQKLYTVDSAPYKALQATKVRTEKRFAKYAQKGYLCGDDGLPHLISDPGLAVRFGHAGETFIPTIGFLYIAGYIGSAGRTYLQEIGSRQKPTEHEIIIDVPLATSIAFKSWDWPGKAVDELMSGQLTEADANIPVSPR